MSDNNYMDTTAATMPMRHTVQYVNNVLVPCGGAVIFEGGPGITKSSRHVANAVDCQEQDPDFGGCCANFAAYEGIDIRGLPQVGNTGDPRSRYGMPAWQHPVPEEGLRGAYPALCPEHLRGNEAEWTEDLRYAYVTADDQLAGRMPMIPYSRGIMIIDECLQVVEETVLLPMAQLFSEHRVGAWGVPMQGWAIVGLTNRMQDRSGARELFPHIANRVDRINVTCDLDDVDPYWLAIGLNQYWRHYAATNSPAIFPEAVPDHGGQFVTPRSWTVSANTCAAWFMNVDGVPAEELKDYLPPHDHPMLRTLITARCGAAVALDFASFLQNQKLRPTMEEILKNPNTAKLPGDSPVIRSTVEMIVDGTKLDDMKAISTYIRRPEMPAVMRSIFCQRLARRVSVVSLFKNRHFAELVDYTGPATRNLLFSAEYKT